MSEPLFYSQEAYDEYMEEITRIPMSFGEAHREAVQQEGADYPDREYLLSDRDVWYKNPYYTGKPGPHPEEDRWEFDDLTPAEQQSVLQWQKEQAQQNEEAKARMAAPRNDDEIPF